jgi:N-acetylglucosamine kinase-like BadF-type ATPase
VSEAKRYVVGVDGGGTRTRAILVGLDGAVLAEREGGATNLQRVSPEEAAKVIFHLIAGCCEKDRIVSESLQNIVLGVAGAGRPNDRSSLVEALSAFSVKHKFPLRNISVETDARIALEAAFAGGPGIVLIGGTGSIALYRTEDGKILRSGGWGRILGDEGSGYAVARDALNAVMRQYDGRAEKTLLTAKALEFFNVPSPEELIIRIHFDKMEISGFAPQVLLAATERDRTAHTILIENAKEMADLVRHLVMKVMPKRKLPVSLMGGLLEDDNPYSKLVKEKIASALPQVVILKPKFPASFGAAIIGLNAFR